MANSKKLTKKEMFANLIAKYDLTQDEIDFCNHEIELLSRKNSKSNGKTKAQIANDEIKVQILEVMEVGTDYTVTDIQKAVGLESNQKTSALIRQLKDENLVERKEIKGRAYFSKVA